MDLLVDRESREGDEIKERDGATVIDLGDFFFLPGILDIIAEFPAPDDCCEHISCKPMYDSTSIYSISSHRWAFPS